MILRKRFYHCKRIVSEDKSIILYEEPIEKWENYQPLSGYVDAVTYGESITKKWRMFVPLQANIGEYKENDLLYLDEAADGFCPNKIAGYENGDGANDRITAVLPQGRQIRIEIERVIEKV